jgi:hypothetical protein
VFYNAFLAFLEFIPGIRLEASFSNGMSGGPFDRDHPMERRRGGNTAKCATSEMKKQE